MVEKESTQKIPYSKLSLDKERVVLITLGGPSIGKEYVIEKDHTIIGRGDNCDIQILDRMMSRTHCQIVKSKDKKGNERYYIFDLDSTNGTFVNNNKVNKRLLKNEDKILMGNTILQFLHRDRVEISYQDKIYSRATTDDLTGLHNRQHFLEELEKELYRARRYQRELSILMIDIDHFKDINDTYGHAVGDKVLKELGKILIKKLRKHDIACRYGGEEFVVALPETASNEAHFVAEKLRKYIESYKFSDNDEMKVMVSIGVASFTKKINSVDTLIIHADQALYRSKAAGRNMVTVFDG